LAIYPDKKAGKLTGRFRVELQKGKQRYRKRWDTYAEAQKDEEAVLAAWATGEAPPAPGAAPGAPDVHTFGSVIPLAKGKLWVGQSTEETSWARLEKVAGILGRNTRLDDVDTQAVDRVITALQKAGTADATINRYLSHLRTFLVWAKRRKYRTVPIKDEIEFAWRKESVGRIRWITDKEERELREYLTAREDPKGRAAALAVWKLIFVAVRTGCRRDELLTAELSQINGTRLHLWETKTDTPRTVPMTQETTDVLLDLIRSGTMPSQRSLRSWWDRAKAAIGLAKDDEFVFHVTRHTCATRLVDAGVNVFVIKEWMGHKRIETTLRYAHVKPQNLEDALVRVGDYVSAANENSRFSANNSLPHAHPTGAGMGSLSPERVVAA
jgi:integrase